MWLVFLGSVLAFALLAIVVVWIGNKVYLSMKRDELKYKKELDNIQEESENE